MKILLGRRIMHRVRKIAWLGVLTLILLGASVVVALLGSFTWAILLGVWAVVVAAIQIADSSA